MKIGNVEVTTCKEVLVLPRVDADIIFTASAVTTMDTFEKLVPEPKAPGIRTKEGFRPDTKDETYQQLVQLRGDQRFAYIVIKSLEPSNIEWDKVNIEDPGTWSSWRDELKAAGISDVEINRIIACVLQANALDEDKLKEAREVFLLGRAQ